MSASECAKQLVDQVVDILTQHGVEMDKIFAAQDDLLKVSTVWFNKFGKLEKELDDQKVLTNKLLQKVCTVEKKLKDCIMNDRRRQFNNIRSNVICRSEETLPTVKKFLIAAIEHGGGGKVTQASLPGVEIPPAPGKTRTLKMYRVTLAEGYKKHLFKGLPLTSVPEDQTGVRVDNEVAPYLTQTKKNLERISFSLRSKYKDSKKLKIKIYHTNLALRIKYQDSSMGAKEWLHLDDDRASEYVSTSVFFRPEETPAGGAPSVIDFYKDTLALLDL